MVKTFDQEFVALGDLHLAEYNPREMSDTEMEKLVRSLREFGFVEPVVARREDGLIVGGHQRVTAMRRLLAEEGNDPSAIEGAQVPVVFVDGMSDEKAKLLNLALNKISGEWDFLKLHELLDSLDGLTDNDILTSGFTQPEIDDILGLMGDLPPLDDLNLEDPDAAIAATQRRLVAQFDSKDDYDACVFVLKRYGMKKAGDTAQALLAALRDLPSAGNNDDADHS